MANKTVDADFVLEHIDEIPIVDVRPAAMYEAGHIPGAINIDYIAMDEDGDVDTDLVPAFEAAGLNPDDEFIVYCQTGMHAGLTCDVLIPAGYEDIDYYQGSFGDWSTDPSRPVEK